MKNDNGKKIYFDKGLDMSDYKIRHKYDSEVEIREAVSKLTTSTVELDFEVKTIMRGKRQVRDGDYCILSTFDGDSMYVMKNVNGEHVWIKQSKLPFKMCVDDMLTMKTIPESTCVFDTYANICKTLRGVQANTKYNKLKSKIAILDSMIDYTKELDDINSDISTNEDMKMLVDNEFKATLEIDKLPSVDLDEFFGDEVDNDEMVLTFNDNAQYAVMYADKDGGKNTTATEISGTSLEFVDMMIAFMELTIDDFDKKQLVDFVNDQVKSYNLNEKLEKERARLEKQVVRGLYDTNKEYRQKTDDVIKKKLETITYNVLTEMYYDIAKHCIAYLSLIIMSKYPDVLIKNVYPSCVKYMSYQGYPINEKNSLKSISKYMCCLVKSITSGSDLKYDKIQSTQIDDFNDVVTTCIDRILKDDVNLRLRVEANKSILQTRAAREDTHARQEFHGFRPSFDFSKDPSNKIAKMLRELNNTIKASKHLKIAITKVPYLFNSCCLEKLDNSLTYYKYFENSHDFKTLKRNIKSSKRPRNTILYPNIVINKKTEIKEGAVVFDSFTDIGDQYKVTKYDTYVERITHFISNNTLFLEDSMLKDISKKYDDDSYWDDVVFSKTLRMYESITDFMMNVNSNYDRTILDGFKNTLILLKDVIYTSSIRYTMFNFMRTTLKRMVSQVIHSHDAPIIMDDTNIIKHIHNACMNNVDVLYFEKDLIKNVTFLNYVLVQFIYNIIVGTIKDKPEPSSTLDESILFTAHMSSNTIVKGNISLVCDFINSIITSLFKTVSLNDLNINNINKRIEELREEKKQVLITKYRKDDESRQTQMALRKLGANNWEDVDEMREDKDKYVDMLATDDINIADYRNKVQEDENYDMRDQLGEDPDNGEED